MHFVVTNLVEYVEHVLVEKLLKTKMIQLIFIFVGTFMVISHAKDIGPSQES